MAEDFYSVSQVAKIYKVSRQAIRMALKKKRLKGRKIGAYWVIPKSQIKAARDVAAAGV